MRYPSMLAPAEAALWRQHYQRRGAYLGRRRQPAQTVTDVVVAARPPREAPFLMIK